MNNKKQQFIDDAIFSWTLTASLQRSKTYNPGASEKNKEGFRKELQRLLVELAKKYTEDDVPESEHMRNIQYLANAISAKCGNVLVKNRFRIGIAQKALNLYLKYLWCLGRLKEAPPHCPFDSIVIDKIPGCEGIKWTKFDGIEKYKKLVSGAHRATNGRPLAEWELETWLVTPE